MSDEKVHPGKLTPEQLRKRMNDAALRLIAAHEEAKKRKSA